MVELNVSAAYIRKSNTAERGLPAANTDLSLEQRVFALLGSANTLESLSRRISQEQKSDKHATQEEVAAVLRHLLDRDLIELSPDS